MTEATTKISVEVVYKRSGQVAEAVAKGESGLRHLHHRGETQQSAERETRR